MNDCCTLPLLWVAFSLSWDYCATIVQFGPLTFDLPVQVPSGNVQVPLFIELPGSSPQLLRVSTVTEFVGDVKEAIIVKFKLDIAPQYLQLFKLGDDDSRIVLDSSQTLTGAGLCAGTKLEVKIAGQGPPPAPADSRCKGRGHPGPPAGACVAVL